VCFAVLTSADYIFVALDFLIHHMWFIACDWSKIKLFIIKRHESTFFTNQLFFGKDILALKEFHVKYKNNVHAWLVDMYSMTKITQCFIHSKLHKISHLRITKIARISLFLFIQSPSLWHILCFLHNDWHNRPEANFCFSPAETLQRGRICNATAFSRLTIAYHVCHHYARITLHVKKYFVAPARIIAVFHI